MRRIALCLLALSSTLAHGQGDRVAKFASGPGTLLYVSGGLLLPFLRDGDNAKMHGLRTFDSLATSLILSEGLKRATRVPRPDTGTRDSFPSGHTTAAFSIATMESAFHPKEAPLWYLGASAIGWSRVSLERHRVGDVLGGALLGYLTARWELSQPRGLLIRPFVSDSGRLGLLYSSKF